MDNIIYEPLPGYFTWILAGGTRQAIKLNRPWQKPLEALLNPAKCPFCTKPQEKISLPGIPDGWQLLPNPMTPHIKHRLITPVTCWPAEKPQVLGGMEEIAKALEICRLATIDDDMEIALVIHVGWLAGQGLGHPHWHVCDAQERRPIRDGLYYERKYEEKVVCHHEEYTVVADGEKPGQLLILPCGPMDFNKGTIPWLAEEINYTVNLCNEKFRSADQGLPPEFAVTVRISADNEIRYASYCPQLAPTSCGFHHTIAALEGGPYILPWTHEATAAYLRKP